MTVIGAASGLMTPRVCGSIEPNDSYNADETVQSSRERIVASPSQLTSYRGNHGTYASTPLQVDTRIARFP